jgi:hypothetical protein
VSLGFFEEDILERRENIPYSKTLYRENYPGCNKNKLKIIITRDRETRNKPVLSRVEGLRG